MKFLVTGSAGLVGSQIVKDLVQKNHTVYSCYHVQKPLQGIPTLLDLTDETQMIQTLDEIKPDTIIHLAAMTGVDLCETEKELQLPLIQNPLKFLQNKRQKKKSFFFMSLLTMCLMALMV